MLHRCAVPHFEADGTDERPSASEFTKELKAADDPAFRDLLTAGSSPARDTES